MDVLLVRLQMSGQVPDTLGQDGDLHLGRPGVASLAAVFLDEFLLALGRNRHRVLLFLGVDDPHRLDPATLETGECYGDSTARRPKRGAVGEIAETVQIQDRKSTRLNSR